MSELERRKDLSVHGPVGGGRISMSGYSVDMGLHDIRVNAKNNTGTVTG